MHFTQNLRENANQIGQDPYFRGTYEPIPVFYLNVKIQSGDRFLKTYSELNSRKNNNGSSENRKSSKSWDYK